MKFLETIETGKRTEQLAALRIVLLGRLEIATGRDVAAISKEFRELLAEIKPAKPLPDLELLRDRLAGELAGDPESPEFGGPGARDTPALSRELRAVIMECEAAGAGSDESVSDRLAEQRRNRRAAAKVVLPTAVGQ